MPIAAPKPCSQCGALVRDGSTRCAAHKVRAGSFSDATRGSRHERGYGAEWERTRQRILARDFGICQPCLRNGRVHRGTDVDHRVPRNSGGTDDDDNLQTICRPVHRAKTAVENSGRLWDEAAHYAAEGGWENPGRPGPTDRSPDFLSRAGVSEGGVPQSVVGGAP